MSEYYCQVGNLTAGDIVWRVVDDRLLSYRYAHPNSYRYDPVVAAAAMFENEKGDEVLLPADDVFPTKATALANAIKRHEDSSQKLRTMLEREMGLADARLHNVVKGSA